MEALKEFLEFIETSKPQPVKHLLRRVLLKSRELTGADYLTMAGGVALNCVANGKLLRRNTFKDIWIQPAAGDAGGAVGSPFLCRPRCPSGRLPGRASR